MNFHILSVGAGKTLLKLHHVQIQRGVGDRGSGPPLKYHKNIGFLSNTGPDPLENHKTTKPAFNVWPSSALKWRFAGGPMMARLYWYFDPPPLIN